MLGVDRACDGIKYLSALHGDRNQRLCSLLSVAEVNDDNCDRLERVDGARHVVGMNWESESWQFIKIASMP